MPKKTTKKKTETAKYVPLEWTRFCPNCGKAAMTQQPYDVAQSKLQCGKCGVKFRLEAFE